MKKGPICPCCHKRVEVLKDPSVLGVDGFRLNLCVCQSCIDWMRKQQGARQAKKENRRQMILDSGDYP